MKTRMENFDRQISDILNNWHLPRGKGKETVKEELLSAIRTTKREKVISLEKWHWVAAACLTIVLLSYAVFYSGKIEHTTFNNQQVTVTLPDGSTALINAGSSLNYNKYVWLFNRNVNLSGEGFFKVTKGSQFKVNTSNGSVKVLGTSFNVFSRDGNFQVTCYEGKVNVDHQKHSKTILPGEIVTLEISGNLTQSSLNKPAHQPEWLSGGFSYNNATLSEVLDEIERQFDVYIESGEFASELLFTGQWNKSMGVDNVLEIVCLPFGLTSTEVTPNNFKVRNRQL